MKAHLFKFDITDFEEVYAVIDEENKRLHASPINYSYNITLDLSLSRDLHEQLERRTQWGEMNFNKKVRKVVGKIIEEIGIQ